MNKKRVEKHPKRECKWRVGERTTETREKARNGEAREEVIAP